MSMKDTVKSPKKNASNFRYLIASNFRYVSLEHHELVKRAAVLAGLSVNAWIVERTLAQARKELNALK
jgi:predicted HicB family RNase H-like nuclease